jgi:16S rRNA (adenine1518-N6/adenine1519-N6)-dimethyltransferase
VVGNLPYNVSSPILFKLLHAAGQGRVLADATLMLQKEVADRLTAAPGSADYGSVAIQVALLADVERVLTLPPGAFRPPPKVTSAVVRLDFLAEADVIPAPPTFDATVRGLFTRRRKTLGNCLAAYTGVPGATAAEWLREIAIDPRRRPETLTIGEFASVAARLRER